MSSFVASLIWFSNLFHSLGVYARKDLKRTGQCSWNKIGVTCSLLRLYIVRNAAKFCIHCRWFVRQRVY